MVDPITDANLQVLHVISNLVELPDLVKDASHDETAVNVSALPSSVFAESAARQFPCHTPAATVLSQGYLTYGQNQGQVKTAKGRELQESINRFADYWGVRPICDQLKTAIDQSFSPPSEAELPDTDFALVVKYAGQIERRMPLVNATCVEAAGPYLMSNRSRYPYEWRKTAARRILTKAAELSVGFDGPVQEYLERAAGYGASIADDVAEGLFKRALLVGDAEREHQDNAERNRLIELAQEVSTATLDGDVAEKLAELIDDFDRRHKLYSRYGDKLATPEEVVFTVVEKEASALASDFVELPNGDVVGVAELERLTPEDVEAAFGGELAKQATRDDAHTDGAAIKELIKEATPSTLQLLYRLMDERGVEKVARKRRTGAAWMDPNNWKQWAKEQGHGPADEDFQISIPLNHKQRVNAPSEQMAVAHS